MKKADPFLVLFILSLLALFSAFLIPWPLPAILLSSACVAAAVLLLYRNLGALSDLPDDHPKLGTLRIVTVFNLTLLLLCTVLAVLLATGAVRLTEDGEKYLAAAVVSIILLFLGNLAPKLPRTRHTGLRLPWTVRDDDAWICAHRVVGYMFVPLFCFYAAGVLATGDVATMSGLVMLLWIGVPGALSYRVYRNKFPRKRFPRK